MNILYGIHSKDNGHLNRSLVMVEALRKKGVDVSTIFSGKVLPESNFFVERLQPIAQLGGVTTVVEKGKNKIVKSFKNSGLQHFMRDVRNLDLTPYDLVINDYEHVSAWAAKQQKKRCIGLTRACTFRYKIPWPKTHLISRVAYSYGAPCDVNIGLHWHHFNQPILPPITAISDLPYSIEEKGFILVYLSAESLEHQIKVFEQCQGRFHIYHPAVDKQLQFGNLKISPINIEEFKKEIHSCRGIITHGGFNTLTEGLMLGKPLLIKPKKKSIEQKANAMTLGKLGFGKSINKLKPTCINNWLENLTPARQLEFLNYSDDLVNWILENNAEDLTEFSKRIWSKIDNGFNL